MIEHCSKKFFATVFLSFGALLGLELNLMADDTTIIAHATAGPLACEIRRAESNGGLQLTGIISSMSKIKGDFRFLLTKSGPGGSSHINQGNSFDLSDGAGVHVGNVTINLGHDDNASVELIATPAGGVTCRASATLKP